MFFYIIYESYLFKNGILKVVFNCLLLVELKEIKNFVLEVEEK